VTLDLPVILLFIVGAFVYSLLPSKWRGWLILSVSVIGVYVFQPFLPIRFSDFILPTLTLVVTLAGWWFSRPQGDPVTRDDTVTLAVIVALIIGLSLMRFVDESLRITPSRPPDPLMVVVGLLVAAVIIVGGRRFLPITALVLLIIAIFVIWRTNPLAAAISGAWRGATGQDVTLASIRDFNWLGFSYIAFRLIHTLRDRQSGILPALSLREYASYVLFFPAFVAGPIDRAERFVGDYRALPQLRGLDANRFGDGLARIAMGVFKKFVIADSLAMTISLSLTNATQIAGLPAFALFVYGYALRLFFDFSGYSDIAIGIGILFGIRLPENFNRPYLKTNLTAFWQSWHATLSAWVRAYVFSPLSRAMIKRKWNPVLNVLIAQLATMIVIGLWHGIELHFIVWGVWHGFGLFVHKQWSDRTRAWYRGLAEKPAQKRAWTAFSWFVTFHYVVIGWVWFVLPLSDALRLLLGVGS
jgi:alginate O-acetyltransferase complex protein AlgI